MRKLFKGGNYSRAENIYGNTVVKQGSSKRFNLVQKHEEKKPSSLNWKKYPVSFKLGKKSSSSNSIFQPIRELENLSTPARTHSLF